MKRDLKRFYRQHGIRYLALPFIVVLALAALADQRLGSYLEHREQAADLQAQLERNQEVLRLDAKVRRSHDELAGNYTRVAPQLFAEADPQQSLAALQTRLLETLRSLYMENVEFFDPVAIPQASSSRLEVGARFTAVPQQLPRLQVALAGLPQWVQVQALELRVVPDPARGAQQLAVTARFAALHAPALPEPEATGKPRSTP